MVDLHSHVLPDLDDGPVNLDFSVALAQAAVEAGTELIVATPHIRADHHVDPGEIPARVEKLNGSLYSRHIPLRVLPGGELSLAKTRELDDDVLSTLCLGEGRHLLVESPYRDMDEELETTLSELQGRGFSPLLAHPERSAAFLGQPDRLAELVARGVLASITAGSMAGHFGQAVRRFTLSLIERGLVHDVASDAHNHLERPPSLTIGFEAAEDEMPGIAAQAGWYTKDAPSAILLGRRLPPRPQPPRRRRSPRVWPGTRGLHRFGHGRAAE